MPVREPARRATSGQCASSAIGPKVRASPRTTLKPSSPATRARHMPAGRIAAIVTTRRSSVRAAISSRASSRHRESGRAATTTCFAASAWGMGRQRDRVSSRVRGVTQSGTARPVIPPSGPGSASALTGLVSTRSGRGPRTHRYAPRVTAARYPAPVDPPLGNTSRHELPNAAPGVTRLCSQWYKRAMAGRWLAVYIPSAALD